jgi:exonuclease SbcC
VKFERVRIRNFKCYDETELSLRPGVTVIHGVNGSGKSSLLEACFFALYGAAAIDGTLDEAIANDAEEMGIVLEFTHDGGDYRVEREVKLRGDTAQTTTCVLETPDGQLEGVTDVEAHIEGLLRMDADAFLNCAYVRQGEVNKLINASPGERQDMIDDLLQLGKLETYRERASDARVGVKRVRDRKRELLADREEAIGAKEDEDLHGQLNALESDLEELINDIETKEREREAARETLEEAKTVLETAEDRREEIESLEAEIGGLTDAIAEAEREREEIDGRIGTLREELDALEDDLESAIAETDLGPDVGPEAVQDRLDDLQSDVDDLRERIETRRLEAQEHANEAESERKRAEERREQAREAAREANELEAEAEEATEKLEAKRGRLAGMDERIDELRETIAGAPVERDRLESHRESVRSELDDANERLAELRTELKNARESVAEAERLLEAGKCPECGQPIEGSPDLEAKKTEIESLETDHERAVEFVESATELSRLTENRGDVRSLIDEREDAIADKRERAETLREEATGHETDAEAAEERADAAADAAETAREKIGELNRKKGDLDDERTRLERVEELLEEIDETERDAERLRERRTNKAELNDQRRDRLAEKRDRKADLEAEFDEAAIEEAEDNKTRAEEYLAEVEPYLEERRQKRDELQNRLGAVRNEIEELEKLRTQRDELEAVVERLGSLYEEAVELEETYADLRAELRQRNVDRLEAMLNETFDLVYQNDSYARIELDGDYELTVYQKDGTELAPDQLSGGERALFNLSLRCAIYRLLSEGIEGKAPTPPLILDEPTVFLDAGHVSKLVELIESMTDHGVAQIIVVSHDEELVGAADDLVAVRKDPTTNRSSVERSVTPGALS